MFTTEDVERYNRFTHFPKDVGTENQRFRAESEEILSETKTRLARYGIQDIPEDVQEAIDRLTAARYNLTREFTRSREVAPPWTVVGPANYKGNHDRAHAIERNAMERYEAAKERLRLAIKRHSPNRPISSDDADAIDRLEAKIQKAEKFQEAAKAINKIIRSKKHTQEEKVAQIVAEGLVSETTARKLFTPDFAGRVGIPSFEITNNAANIRRMKERVQQLERAAAAVTVETETTTGIRIVDNVEDNRVQIFFPDKPAEEIRIRLKEHSFRWAPSVGAWQRHRSEGALHWARTITTKGAE